MQSSQEWLVTITVPVYNAEETIEKCILSLLNQSYPKKEIIIIDDGSTDSTPMILEKLSEMHHPHLKVISVDHKGRSSARNVGLKLSNGEIVAFAEADAIYHRDWLASALKHFESTRVAGVLGPRYCSVVDTTIRRCIDLGLKIRYKDPSYKPPTGWIFRKSTLLEVGGFDEKLSVAEDKDLGMRLEKKGYTIAYEPTSVWWHMEPETLGEFIRRIYQHSKERVWFYVKYPLEFPLVRVVLFLSYLVLLIVSLLSFNVKLSLFMLAVVFALVFGQAFRLFLKTKRASLNFLSKDIVILAVLDIVKNAVFVVGTISSFKELIFSRSKRR